MFTERMPERDAIGARAINANFLLGSANTGYVDMSTYARVRFFGATGFVGTGAQVDGQLVESDFANGANSTPVIGSNITPITTGGAAIDIEIQAMQLSKRYVAGVLTVSGAQSRVTLFPIASDGRYHPVGSTPIDLGGGGSSGGGAMEFVFTPLHDEPPLANYAILDTVNQQPVLKFSNDTAWSAIFGGVMPNTYGGGNLTLGLVWAGNQAGGNGNVVWQAAWERQPAGGNLQADDFASAQANVGMANATAGFLTYTTIPFSSGQIDGLQAGESFRLRITRDAANGTDNYTGFTQLIRVDVREN